MKKPIIGIVPLVDAGRDSLWMLPGYMDAIAQAGGLGVMLPLAEDGADIRRLLEGCNGVLLTGGHDVSPALYGQEILPVCGELCPARDRMEGELLRQAIDRDLAVLGICRGMQFMNAVLGGTLYQDLPAQRPSDCDHHMAAPYDREAHKVSLPRGTPLAELLGKEEMGVNSCHHQAVRDLAPRLAPMALAPDGVTEAVYMPERRFVWGVQWHPEFSWRVDERSRKIFAAFTAASLCA
ncbi:MAG: gamma-glutamyl-gamma-aminobutyrate hydrolase family protein [Oscillospiraceae bacterium]|jgi:putative glutamine amidotransferase|nr:gamma-glutamyl-gamma-aminobutyrate hydrolase family protein [Oscillospiraceae bacterium]MCI9563944.1 gamma-glutamyl-gamma-aminobutyrate hydrolase family protein [Oscillospiraceae bacterium]